MQHVQLAISLPEPGDFSEGPTVKVIGSRLNHFMMKGTLHDLVPRYVPQIIQVLMVHRLSD